MCLPLLRATHFGCRSPPGGPRRRYCRSCRCSCGFTSPLRAITRYTVARTERPDRAAGCPHGSLCRELDKRADGPGLAAELIRVPVDWAERQFQAMGRPDARDLAVEVIARYQGTALLASTLRDPSLMEGEGRRVARWIDALG